MTVSFDLPAEIEQSLRQALGDLNAAAKEAALVELYRQDRLTQRELAIALGMTRLEVHAVLKKHNVDEDLPSADEIAQESANLRQMLKR